MPAGARTNANVNVRVDETVKRQSQDLFSSLGMDISTAVNIFLRQAIRKNGLPFEVVSQKTRRNPPQFGCMKGKIKEVEGHDWFEPLEDFEEYM